MRGGITRQEAWLLSHEEREDISKIIEERIKLAKDSGNTNLL